MLLRSGATALACLFPLTSLIFLAHVYTRKTQPAVRDWAPTTWTPTASPHSVNSCPNRLDWLNNLTITYPIKYARRDIVVNPKSDVPRASVTKIDTPLFPEFQTLNLSGGSTVQLEHCTEPLILDVPSIIKDVDASKVMFGMSTTLERLNNSIPFLSRWLTHTHAGIFVIVVGPDEQKADSKAMAILESGMRYIGLDVTIVHPLNEKDSFPERYYSLTRLLYSNRNSKTQWIGIIDDDTIFPSMPSLISMLNSYDSKEQYYIGGLSEDWWSVSRYGMMGFGGAGIFLSITLAATLDPHYQDCKDKSGSGSGDVRIMECIYDHTLIKLTHVPGLHQIDLHGDLSGLYESGRSPLSLHHWKQGWWDEEGYGKGFPMAAMHLVADVCGGACFLQRWQFGTDMILSNGYSVATYPKATLMDDQVDLDMVERTWVQPGIVEGSLNHGIDHYLGPGRPMLVLEKEKIQYRFLDAIAVDGGVKQFYIHLGVDEDLDALFELFWINVDYDDLNAER